MVVYLNGFDLGVFNFVVRLVTALLNVATIFMTISFVLFIINPEKVARTVTKLIEDNVGMTEGTKGDTIPPVDYMAEFIPLEKLIRSIYNHQMQPTNERWEMNYRNNVPLTVAIRYLFEKGLISRQQFEQLLTVSKVRNLAAHGENARIESHMVHLVTSLYASLQNMFPNVN